LLKFFTGLSLGQSVSVIMIREVDCHFFCASMQWEISLLHCRACRVYYDGKATMGNPSMGQLLTSACMIRREQNRIY